MAKRKRNGGSQSGLLQKLGSFLLIVILLAGCYLYLKQEDKLPEEFKNVKVEKFLDDAISETGQLKKNLINKVEEGLESAKTELQKGKKAAHDASESLKGETKGKRNTTSSDEVKPGSLNLKLEIPVALKTHDEVILKRYAYTVSYNNRMKNPNWVAWELTRKETTGKEERTNKFVPDPDLKEPRVKTSDYTGTGYDRGHMAPAADMKWSQRAMEESFYMSNICPQHKNLNRGDWNDLEDACRAWAKKYGTVYIACGPIYNHSNPKRIGKNKVAVPDRFFKVVLIYNRKDPMAFGFVFQNIARSQSLEKYQTTVDDIEHMTGYDFFSKLPDHIEDYIEAEIRALPSTRN